MCDLGNKKGQETSWVSYDLFSKVFNLIIIIIVLSRRFLKSCFVSFNSSFRFSDFRGGLVAQWLKTKPIYCKFIVLKPNTL